MASAVDVEAWFARRTWHAGDFDTDELARRKASQGVSVSVVLPARDEVSTVAGVVAAARALLGTLVDEVVVVDGGSTDGTQAAARRAGARVVAADELCSAHGPALGKGDALWRSLVATHGDLVVWIDSDIRNPRPGFVAGLLGPLLTQPDVVYVKAFYERPIRMGEVLHPIGGGRVTELTARPLLNLFWPHLSGLVQPLAGEYAGRREVLERVPFWTGYGVEVGLLVDIADGWGVDAIGQVDLDERVHRNQSLEALSRMAYGVLQVALHRLRDEGRLPALAQLPTSYVQFVREADRVVPRQLDVRVLERPPHRPRAG